MARTDDAQKPEGNRAPIFSGRRPRSIKARWARPGVISTVVMAVSLILTAIAFAIIFGVQR